MPRFACNIDRRGRAARAISGFLFLALGVAGALGVLGIDTPWIRIAFGAVFGLLGVVQLFEARAGWCVVRAMGGKTPL